MRFRKYHGAGNDFVMLSDLDARLGPATSLDAQLVAALCDRHIGIGADGVIRVMKSASGGRYMDYYNSDGSVAEMCGNGIRCLVLHEQDAGRLDDGEHVISTLSRDVVVRPAGRGRFTVDMGRPVSSGALSVELSGDAFTGTAVDMGNPHFVLFTDEIGRALDDETVHGLGSQLETHPDFPNHTNVEFVRITGATSIEMRVWERGCGETLACGSGICAAVVASSTKERTGPHVAVTMPGGELEVEIDEGGHVWLTGPAEASFEGEIDRAWLEARGLAHHNALVELSS
jgi:diaminopimelate epimerase